MVQHRDRFEFNENFLNLVAHHSSSCRFVEFMLESELERLRAGAPFYSDPDDDDDGGTLKGMSCVDECTSEAMSRTASVGRASFTMRPSVSQSVSAPIPTSSSTVRPMPRIGGGIAPSPPTTPRHAALTGGPGHKTLTPAHAAAGGNQTMATSTPDGCSSLAPPHAETASISSSSADASTAAVAAYPFFHSLYSYFKYYSNQTPRFHNPYFIDRQDYKVCFQFSAYCISIYSTRAFSILYVLYTHCIILYFLILVIRLIANPRRVYTRVIRKVMRQLKIGKRYKKQTKYFK